VSTRVEPVQNVRIGTETVTEHEVVSDEVRKERVDVETEMDPDWPQG
jgi:hypothetical protein